MDLEFYASCVETTPSNSYTMNVVANCVDVMDIAKDVIEELDIDTIITLVDNNESLLDVIGLDFCLEYFDLKPI